MKRLRESAFETSAADWYRADLTVELREVARPDDAAVELVAIDEVADWLQELRPEFGWAWVDDEIEAARRHGHVFAVVRVQGERAGYVKVGYVGAYVTDFGRCIAIPSGSAFIYDTFVHPRYRTRGFAGFAVACTCTYLKSRGMRSLWCHIPRWNVPSVRVFARCGFVPMGYIRCFRVLGRTFCTQRPERLLQRVELARASRGVDVLRIRETSCSPTTGRH